MKIPFYQTTWNGVDLRDLAKELKHPLTKLPDELFYQAYYKKISENQSALGDQWKLAKQNQTKWLQQKIDALGGKDKQVLSVGAGTGIIELPLIRDNYNIDLQECQKDSLNLIGAADQTICYDVGLNSIQNSTYDLIVAVAMTYALDDAALNNFFIDCSKLLKSRGVIILLDTSLSWLEIYAHFRNKKTYRNDYLFWGYKRSLSDYLQRCFGFKNRSHEFYDGNMCLIKPKKILGVPFNMLPTWQMMEFQKND